MSGSHRTFFPYLGTEPRTEHLDLSEWYRFQKPGHYSVRFLSSAVWRAGNIEEGGGTAHLTLESNFVEFDILPADQPWATEEQNKIEAVLNTEPNDSPRWREALARLSKLDTPASSRSLVQMYLAAADDASAWQFDNALRGSLQLDSIIAPLQAALVSPSANLPPNIANLVADLQTRKELGIEPPLPADTAKRPQWIERSRERTLVHDKYFGQANTLLSASIEKRIGRPKATAIYQAWLNAEGLNWDKAISPEMLARLRLSVLAVQNDLTPSQQMQLVYLAWHTLSHDQLLPLIRKLAGESLDHPEHDSGVVKFWCEEWAEECDKAILDHVRESGDKTSKTIILLLAEAEHPELDQLLEERLHDPAMLQDSAAAQRTAVLVLRAGTRKLVSHVESFLDRLAANRRYACEERGDLLGYLFRFAPKDARRRLGAELQQKEDVCGSQLLRILHNDRYSDDIVPVAIAALNSPNSAVVQTAALFLAEHAAAPAEDALWKRLDVLRNESQDQTAEPRLPGFGSAISAQGQPAMLEQALTSALTHARNWKLTPGDLERLRTGCLTDPCRSIVDGKMSFSL
jgi:hypothetical protein